MRRLYIFRGDERLGRHEDFTTGGASFSFVVEVAVSRNPLPELNGRNDFFWERCIFSRASTRLGQLSCAPLTQGGELATKTNLKLDEKTRYSGFSRRNET
jgi:hypothetical protein